MTQRTIRPTSGAILLAAGRSQRMNGIDKTLAPLAGRPVAAWSIGVFGSCDEIDGIVIVSGERNHESLERLAEEEGGGKVLAVVPGGARRQDSVAKGLAALIRSTQVELIAVHDIARPLTTEQTIRRGLQLAAAHGAAIACGLVTDTVKEVDIDGVIVRTVDRDTLRAVQTPQVFRRELLERAHAEATGDVTDDATLVEALGRAVLTFDSDGPNLKITSPGDLAIAEALLNARLQRVAEG